MDANKTFMNVCGSSQAKFHPVLSPVLNTSGASLRVVCLCAAWCGVCRQYQPEFLALHKKFAEVQFAWLDVEEHEALVDDLDVETFPTVLIGVGEQALFLGPLLPQIKVLERLLQSLQVHPVPAQNLPPEAQALWKRLVAQWHSVSP